MRLSWRGFPIVAVVRSAAHSSRTRASVVEPRVCRDVEIRFRQLPGRPCILTVLAGVWSAMCRFRCASPRSRAARGAAQCKGEREHAIGGQCARMPSFGHRCRPTCRVSQARARACERGQHELPCGYPAAETNRRTVHFDGEGECRSADEPLPAWLAGRLLVPRRGSEIAPRMLIHVDILRPESLEGLWFSTVRVSAWPVGMAGSGVDNRRCRHSKPCVFPR
ncbi:hypothetical protein BLA6993_07359 [Burkholderia lata]|nr:hypothetical protein BLA6993_07359 [Burkholderia lata]